MAKMKNNSKIIPMFKEQGNTFYSRTNELLHNKPLLEAVLRHTAGNTQTAGHTASNHQEPTGHA